MKGPVWVLGEVASGRVGGVSLELTGKARQLAAPLGEQVAGVLIGQGLEAAARELIAVGADTVFLLEHPSLTLHHSGACARVLAGLVQEHQPQIVLAGATFTGNSVS